VYKVSGRAGRNRSRRVVVESEMTGVEWVMLVCLVFMLPGVFTLRP
jgi:hypothetical protein